MTRPKRRGANESNDENSLLDDASKKKKTMENMDFSDLTTDSELAAYKEAKDKKKKKKVSGASKIQYECGSASDAMSGLKGITAKITELLFDENSLVAPSVARKVLGLCGDYELANMLLIAENERLRGRLEAASLRPPLQGGARVLPNSGMMPPPPAPPVHSSKKAKVVETFSAVVRSSDASASPEELLKRVMKEVAPTLGVRVHEVKSVRSGGVLIRTPSKAETQKVMENEKFKELGLEVQLNQKLGPRVVILGVHSEISSDEFMTELYELNLKEKMTLEEFKKGVKLVSRPWKAESDGAVNVVLEGCGIAMDHLLEMGRCYVKWFSFRVRLCNLMPGCFKCMSFDHRVAECKAKAEVCKRCGQSGHKVLQCTNALHCRNCEFKGKPAGHGMMSSACPIYSAIVARALARH